MKQQRHGDHTWGTEYVSRNGWKTSNYFAHWQIQGP